MPRTTSESLITQLTSLTSFPVFLYEIELLDNGEADSVTEIGEGIYRLEDATKGWVVDEWPVDGAEIVDIDGNSYSITSNTSTQVTFTASSEPIMTEYTLRRWFYLAQFVDGYTGAYSTILYNTHSYIPWPIEHSATQDYEIGKFPSISIDIFNPGPEIINFYSDLERYNGLRGCRVNIIMVFVNDSGEIITGSEMKLINEFLIEQTIVNPKQIKFKAQSLGNLPDKRIPKRSYSKLTCTWVYKDSRCAYNGTISSCSKQFKSLIGKEVVIEYGETAGDKEVWYIVDSTFFKESADLSGNLVESSEHNAIWQIDSSGYGDDITSIVFDTDTNPISPRDLKPLLAHPRLTVDIIDKYCCYGHNQPGRKRIYNHSYLCLLQRSILIPNDLVVGGNFDTLESQWGVTLLAKILCMSSISGFLAMDTSEHGPCTLHQRVYDAQTEDCIGDQTTHAAMILDKEMRLLPLTPLELAIKYYGWSINEGHTSVFVYKILLNGGWSYNASTDEWEYSLSPSEQVWNPIECRSSEYATESFNRLFKFDDYIIQFQLPNVLPVLLAVYLRFGNEGEWDTNNESIVILDYVALRLNLQSERFGGFPAIPTSQYWML